jgi:hypothetical protein
MMLQKKLAVEKKRRRMSLELEQSRKSFIGNVMMMPVFHVFGHVSFL